MERVFNDSKRIEGPRGKPLLPWPNVMMRAPITLTGIRDLPTWTRADSEHVARVMTILERNVGAFKEELQQLKRRGAFREAYAFAHGGWDRFGLFPAQDGAPHWDEAACKVAPKTCAALRYALPGRQRGLPYVQHNTEEVVFFHGGPSSRVLPHNGGSNCRINIHIGLEGFDDSKVIVHTDINESRTLAWSDTKAMAFNDGWTHEVVNGPQHRYVLAVAIMHPDIREAHFAEAAASRADGAHSGPGESPRYRRKRRERTLAEQPPRKPRAADAEL